MQSNFKVHIPKPCHEDWNKMTSTEKGKFCKVCDKEVVDFTTMTDDELKNYFLIKKESKLCGHFKNSQVIVREHIIHKWLKKANQWLEENITFNVFKKPALLGIGFMMVIVGCNKPTVEGEIEQAENEDTTEAVKDSIIEKKTTGIIFDPVDSSNQNDKIEDKNKAMKNKNTKCSSDSKPMPRIKGEVSIKDSINTNE